MAKRAASDLSSTAALRVLLYSAVALDEAGGVQAVFQRLSGHLRGHGDQVCELWSGPAPARCLGQRRWIRPLQIELPETLWRLPITLVRAARDIVALARHLRRHRPMLVNLHYVRGEALYFLLLRPWFRYRLVLSFHGSDLLLPSRLSRRLLPFYLRRADAITVVSQHLRGELRARYGLRLSSAAPVRLIPNGIDTAFWSHPAGETPAAAGAAATVLFVGRLEPVKGVDALLRAFAQVAAAVPDARLQLVGDGTLRLELQHLAAALTIAPRLEWRGEVEPRELRRLLQRAALFVLPSRSEGMPLSLLEAMAAGLPCIASRVGGVPELLDQGCGRMVPPEDADALAAAMIELLTDLEAAAQCGQCARERATQFSAAASDTAYLTLLAGLSAGAARRPC